MTIYSVCVGHYKEVSEATKDLKKLNALGYKGFTFNIGECYTLKTVMSPFMDKAEAACSTLKRQGFDAFIRY